MSLTFMPLILWKKVWPIGLAQEMSHDIRTHSVCVYHWWNFPRILLVNITSKLEMSFHLTKSPKKPVVFLEQLSSAAVILKNLNVIWKSTNHPS